MSDDPPPGFERHARRSPLTDPWEPLFARCLDDRTILGLTVAAPHTNSRGFLHGGLIAALADNAMGLSCGVAVRRAGLAADGLVTVSLSLDYLGRARVGDWLVFDTDFIRAGRTLCFAGATVTAAGRPIARAHATFSVLSAAAA